MSLLGSIAGVGGGVGGNGNNNGPSSGEPVVHVPSVRRKLAATHPPAAAGDGVKLNTGDQRERLDAVQLSLQCGERFHGGTNICSVLGHFGHGDGPRLLKLSHVPREVGGGGGTWRVGSGLPRG